MSVLAEEMQKAVLSAERLDALLVLLEDISVAVNNNTAFAPSLRQKKMEHCLAIGFLVSLLVFVVIVASYRLGSGALLSGNPLLLMGSYSSWLIIAIFYITTVIFGMIMALRQHSQNGFVALCQRAENKTTTEVEFLRRLFAFDNVALEYALLHYQRHWGIFDGRLSVFICDLRSIYLFPALILSSVAATMLLQPDSNLTLWGSSILGCCLYLRLFSAVGQRERPEQVIALLECAVRYDGPVAKATQRQVSLRSILR